MAGHPSLDLAEDGNRRTDLARRTVSTLIAIVLDKDRLHWMKVVRRAKPLDSCYRVTLVHYGKAQASVDSDFIHEDGTRAALPVVAPLLGTGKKEVLPQGVKQSSSRVELKCLNDAIHIKIDAHVLCRQRRRISV